MIGFTEAVFGHVPQPPRCLACEGTGGVAAGPQAPSGIGEAALKSPTETGQGNPLVSYEDSQVSGGQLIRKKCGFASELHIWGAVVLSASAGSDSQWIYFYEMIVSKHTY